MKVIWKYELAITNRQLVFMPAGAEILSVANQSGTLCLWAMVNPSMEPENRCIEVVGTGNSVPEDVEVSSKYIGTALVDPFVWHVFEVVQPIPR